MNRPRSLVPRFAGLCLWWLFFYDMQFAGNWNSGFKVGLPMFGTALPVPAQLTFDLAMFFYVGLGLLLVTGRWGRT